MTIEHVEFLLDEIHAAIGTAEFAKLEMLVAQFESESVAINPGIARADLYRLQRKASLNAATAIAASGGVRAALQRIKEIQENTLSLRTYNRDGKRSEISNRGEVSRRL